MLPPNHLELPFMTAQTDCDSPAERIQNHLGINARTHKNTHSEPSVCERVNAHRHWRQSSGVSAHLHRPWLVPLPEEDFCRESETQRRGLPFFRLWPSCCGAGWKALARMCPWLFSPSLCLLSSQPQTPEWVGEELHIERKASEHHCDHLQLPEVAVHPQVLSSSCTEEILDTKYRLKEVQSHSKTFQIFSNYRHAGLVLKARLVFYPALFGLNVDFLHHFKPGQTWGRLIWVSAESQTNRSLSGIKGTALLFPWAEGGPAGDFI